MSNLCKLFIGLDIGGTNVRCTLADSDLKIIGNIQRIQFERLDSAEEEVEKNICSFIEGMLETEKFCIHQIKAIGVSLAALFDRESGCIEYWPNNNLWNEFPLKEYLQKKYGVPVFLEDDANSAALGELYYGAAKGFRSFAYITISTGIGCGLVLNGQIYSGTHGWAGEIGHIKVKDNGLKCRCGATGCLQTLASGSALLERAKELSIYNFNKIIGELDDLRKVVKFAHDGDIWALQVFDEAGRHLADALTNMIMLIDVPLIVIGGGVTSAGNVLINPLKKYLESNLTMRKRKVIVKVAECGDYCGVLGVVALTDQMMKNDREIMGTL